MSSEVISVYAPTHIDPADSYGYIASELVRCWSRAGIHVNVFARGHTIHANQDPELREYVSKPIIPALGGILLGYPTSFTNHGQFANMYPRIALTMFESTKIDPDWVPILNRMSAVIVPSHFCAEVFEDCGVTSTIHVVPLGLNPIYKSVERSHDGPFTYLTFLDRGKRKGGIYALNAFVQEFGDDPNVKLILKAREPKHESKRFNFENENIEVIQKDMTPQELYELYLRCHCLVNPNKGEGFGLIPREFAASGGISLATNWAGTSELIHIWGWPIDYTLEPANWEGIQKFENKDMGQWALPLEESIRSQMRKVYDEKCYFLRSAYTRGLTLHSLYNWSYFAFQVYSIWKDLMDGYRIRSSEIAA